MVAKYILKPLMVANEKNQTCIAISWMIPKLHYIVKYLWLCFIAYGIKIELSFLVSYLTW